MEIFLFLNFCSKGLRSSPPGACQVCLIRGLLTFQSPKGCNCSLKLQRTKERQSESNITALRFRFPAPLLCLSGGNRSRSAAAVRTGQNRTGSRTEPIKRSSSNPHTDVHLDSGLVWKLPLAPKSLAGGGLNPAGSAALTNPAGLRSAARRVRTAPAAGRSFNQFIHS